MSAKANDFKIGLFVLGGIALLLTALFVFGASRFFEGKTVAETYVAGTVEGLKSGAMVTLRGVPVGEVSRINFSWNVYHIPEPRYVVIEFTVQNKVSLVPAGKGFADRVRDEINKGLRARVKSQGLAGVTILSLEYIKDPGDYPPLPTPWKPAHIYIPSAPGQFSEIISALNRTLDSIKEVNFQQMGATLQRDLATGERFLNHLDQSRIEDLGTNVNALVTQFNHIGNKVDGLVDELRTFGNRANAFVGPAPTQNQGQNLQVLSEHADQLLVQLRAATGRLDVLASNVDTTALNQTLERVREASEELAQAIHELKTYPAGALLGRPPPRARSVEPP